MKTSQLRQEISKAVTTTVKSKSATNPLQLVAGPEEELPKQMKQNPLQMVAEEEETVQAKQNPLQLMAMPTANPFQLEEAPAKANNTGLPDNLKAGVENLSGHSLDDVKVHYNSAQPAQLNALAYAQGTDIHVAPGQEEHLPHEAWHVVQQKQGRVQPTIQMKEGVPVNDDKGLENEADVMGEKALSFSAPGQNADTLLASGHPSNGLSNHALSFKKAREQQITQLQQVAQLATKEELIETITGNYNQSVAMFPGNESTPITRTFSKAELIKAIVGMGYSGTRVDFRDLMESVRDNSWCVAAWVHSGGLGGAAGGADPEPHITLMVNGSGIHLRVETGANLVLKNAKGANLDSRGPAVSKEKEAYPDFADSGLTIAGQKKASEYRAENGVSVLQSIAFVKSGCPDGTKYNKGTRQLRYHAESALFGVWNTANGGSWAKDIQANAKQASAWIA